MRLAKEFQNDLKYAVYTSGNFVEFENKWINIIGMLENEQNSGVQLWTAKTIFDR